MLAQQTQGRLFLLRMVLFMDVPKIPELVDKRYINILLDIMNYGNSKNAKLYKCLSW